MRRDEREAPEGRFRLLAVDDQPEVLQMVARLLRRRGFEVEVESRPPKALERLAAAPAAYDLALLDVNMPEMSGLELLARIKELAPGLPVVMLTADTTAGTAVAALEAGAFSYLTKPVEDPKAAAITLRRAGQYGLLERRARELEERVSRVEGFETLIGSAPKMRELFVAIDKLARTDVNVLIEGESGTGKELTARAIHDRSARAERPFVGVNCGALPEGLIDSELFGHAEGAFTGAAGARAGVFLEADRGSLFLDEIGDIPAAVQLRLLRVLQEREVRPVGGDASRPVDVRILAATHVDLEAAVGRKAFREDLYYRLNVVSLRVPPLRERMDDVPLLAAHFLKKHAARQERPVPRLTGRAMTALGRYEWPGNVRELENALQRALAMSPGDEVDLEALPPRVVGGGGGAGDARVRAEDGLSDLSWTDEMTFPHAKRRAQEAFERAYLSRLLRRTRGNISESARLAGLDRSNFRRILARHQISADDYK